MPSTLQTTKPMTADSHKAAAARPLWLSASQLVAALAVVLLALEAVFYLAGIGDQEYLRPDAVTGYSPMAGKHVTWRKEGFARAVFNSWGMRDLERTPEKPRGTFRIAFIGDSFVEALQVERERTFVARVEEMLSKDGDGRKVEAMNFGVSAYNIGQMHLRLKELAMRFHPDLVVACLRSDTTFLLAPDPHGGFIYARPTFFVRADGKVAADYTVQELFYKTGEGKRMRRLGWLREHSRIWGVVSTCVEYLVTEYKDDWDKLQLSVRTFLKNGRFRAQSAANPTDAIGAAPDAGSDPENHRKATLYLWPTADALLKAMVDECNSQNCRVALVRLPGPGGQHNLLEASLMKESAAKLAVPYIDLNPIFADKGKSGINLFFTFHMNEAGHELAAEETIRALRQDHVLPAPGESREK